MGIFHQYDIRGMYGTELTEKTAYGLGKALIKFASPKRVIIGYDSRAGNLKLFSALAQSLTEEGIDVVHAGLITRPMLNWVAWKYKFDLGIIITASHNPKEYNGFKFILHGKPLYYDNGLDKIELLMQMQNPEGTLKDSKTRKKDASRATMSGRGKGKISSIDYISQYVKFLSGHLSPEFRRYAKNNVIKVIADASNGAAGEIIKRLLLENGITYELLFADPDGTFYGHNPNPLDPGAPIVLSKSVKASKADFGFVVDPDGDRIRFVDEKGIVVENSYVDCLVVQHLLHDRRNKGAAIVHDLISRKILSETIVKSKGKSIVSKVGTSNIITCMSYDKALFGCEMSGHRYFKIMNNQDSGLMMLVHLMNTLYSNKNSKKRFSALWKRFDKYADVGELNYKVDDDAAKKNALQNILEYYSKGKKRLGVKHIYSIDGISVVCSNYWFNVRQSNTEPLIRVRIEGKDKKTLLKAQKQLEKFIC